MTSHLSIEQMEIIRRLRNSGATLQQITDAYQTFDNLDKELGSFGLNHIQQKHDPLTNNFPFERLSHVEQKQDPLTNNFPPERLSHIEQKQDPLTNNFPLESPSLVHQIADIPSPQKACKKLSNNTRGFKNHLSQPSPQGSDAGMTSDNIGNSKILDLVDDFRRLPSGVLKEAGKCFLLSLPKKCFTDLIKKCSDTQPTCLYFDIGFLLKTLGMNADDVQTFLNGDVCKLDKDKQTKIVDWFVGILCEADWFIKDVTEYSKDFTTTETSSSDTNENIEFVPKRERIVFHDIHLAVLESNFKRNHYPTYREKSLIANECNIKMAISCGRELHEKDRVNAYNVDSWFRNKRKTLIRKNKSDPSQAVPLMTPKEDRRMEMKRSDIYVYQISNPPTTTDPSHSFDNSPQLSMTLPLSTTPFRPSISIPSRTPHLKLQLQQPSTAENSSNTSPTTSSSNPVPTGDMASSAVVKEEILSDEEKERSEDESSPIGPSSTKLQKLNVSASLWASN